MIDLSLALCLFTAHWVGDFRWQTNSMALLKSRSNKMLAWHVSYYTGAMLSGAWAWGLIDFYFHGRQGTLGDLVIDIAAFLAVTWILHFITDYVTSRWTSKLWFVSASILRGDSPRHDIAMLEFDDEKRHDFFVAIGFDQLVHAWCLLVAAKWLLVI